ncbi:DUF1643 domain-containing protein [Paraburkholderia nemoris]|uniref:DUF1643 domain-containing protein n=1 Tax=Paraburkholderia nemoris TaxID=2793076 RepID=UPI0038BD9B62
MFLGVGFIYTKTSLVFAIAYMTVESHDPGGRVRIKLPADITGEARFSPCGRYRPLLVRRWAKGDSFALWIGMNPSTATGEVDDPTVQREWTYTRSRLGVSAYVKANVMDYRATDPKALLAEGIEPQSESNQNTILEQARNARYVVLAFGALTKAQRRYASELVTALETEGIPLFCLDFTADGSPRHPLYVKQDSPLVPFPPGSYGM